MPRKIRQLKADLRKAGFTIKPGKGSHTVWEHALLPALRVSLSGSDRDDVQRYQENEVRKAIAELREAQGDKP